MNVHLAIRTVVPLVLIGLLGTSGCTPASGTAADDVGRSSPLPEYGTVFLDDGECGRSTGEGYTEVSCDSERAAAQVTARHDGERKDGPRCPARTDFVLQVSEGGDRAGYACMRKLRPPHPGEPGNGGGPRTIVGDCVYAAGKGQVKETACDGSGEHAPEYRVAELASKRAGCPPGTALFVEVGGSTPVGCARPHRS